MPTTLAADDTRCPRTCLCPKCDESVPTVPQPARSRAKTASCEAGVLRGTIIGMDGDELIPRAEVTAMLFTFADINANVRRIVQLLEDEDGEEEASEDDT